MASINRPGVTVVQELSETPAAVSSPTLVPVVVAPCHQIVEAITSTGELNQDAKHSAEKYNQRAIAIPQGNFPDPRANIDEINVDESEVNARLYFGGALSNLDRGSNGSEGSAFLSGANLSTSAAFFFPVSTAGSYAIGGGEAGQNLILGFNLNNPGNRASDVTIRFDAGQHTPEAVATAINQAVGVEVAEVIENGAYGIQFGVGNTLVDGEATVFIKTGLPGATGNIQIRNNASALATFFTANNINAAKVYRIEGSGFRAQDDEDGDLTSPWIEWHRGALHIGDPGTALTDNDVANSAFGTVTGWAGTFSAQTSTFAPSKGTALDFLGADANIPLKAATATSRGDEFWADGTLIGDGEIIAVEGTRFKVGILDVGLSSFDADGNATSRVYTSVEFNTPLHKAPFSPKYAYFVANGLVWGEVTPEGTSASLTGTVAGNAARPAVVMSSVDATVELPNVAGFTVTVGLTIDGIQQPEQTVTLVGGPATFNALAADITEGLNGVTVTAVDVSGDGQDDRFIFSTDRAGADQEIVVRATGENSLVPSLGFPATATGSGSDIEFAEKAFIVGDYLNGASVKSQTDEVQLTLTVTDEFGTHEKALESALDHGDNLDTVIARLAGAQQGDGSFSYDIRLGSAPDGNGLHIATISLVDSDGDLSSIGTAGAIKIETVSSGADVDIDLDLQAQRDSSELTCLGFSNVGSVGILRSEPFDGSPQGNILAQNDVISFEYAGNGAFEPITFTALQDIADADALRAALAASANFNQVAVDRLDGGDFSFHIVPEVDSDFTGQVRLELRTGTDENARVRTVANAPIASLGFSEIAVEIAEYSAAGTPNNTDTGVDSLAGTRLAFTLDENPYVYEIDFLTNSLSDAIDAINSAIGGAIDIASEDLRRLVLTSSFAGTASQVFIDSARSVSAPALLGLSGSAQGSGRPNPNFYLNGDGTVIIGANILRNRTTGIPYNLRSALADIYIEYKGLRLDVTPSAQEPDLLTFDDVDTMIAAIGPISTENPLALACFLALSNAPTQSVSAIGVAATTPAAPMGTVAAHASVLDFLEAKEVYGVAPMTDSTFVQQLYGTHVSSMSRPEERGERIAIIWQGEPSKSTDISIQSGEDAETNGSDNSLTVGTNPVSAIVGAGISDPDDIPADADLYMEVILVSLGETTVRNYSIASANGVVLTLRTTFAADENIDGFFSTTALDGTDDLTALTYAIRVRGSDLVIPGTDIPDSGAIATAAAEQGTAYSNRRVFMTYGRSVDTVIEGVVTNVPGYYVSAAISGMIGEQAPQQPFTRVSINGFSRVYGTDDTFSENQLDTIADGGRYILINQGGRVASRHQRSTATTSIEARELSITKAIDFLAKGLRATNRVYIGRYVINPGFIDQLVMSNEGFLARTVQAGVVNSAALRSVLQDESAPDTVLVEVEVAPAYPCNKIRITIVS